MNNKKEISIIFLILLIIPFYKPGFFDDIDALDEISNVLRVICALIIIVYYLFARNKNNKMCVAFLAFELSFLFSTLINGLPLYTYIKNNFLQIAVFLLFSLCVQRPQMTIKTIFHIGEILTYLNFATIILFPDGLYTNITVNWLLGYKNYYLPFFIGFIITALLYNHYAHFSIRPYILIFFMLLTLALVDSSTSLFILVIFIVLIIFTKNSQAKVFNSITYSVINIILYILIIVYRILDIFSFLIVRIFNKNMTLSGRTRIWDSVIKLIEQKPIIGWGVISLEDSVSLIGLTSGTHAHNMILQYLYTGGIFSLVLFSVFILFITQKLYLYKETYTAKVLSIAIFLYLVGGITEIYSSALIYIMFAFAGNIEYLIPYEHDVKNNKINIKIVLRKDKFTV